MSGVFCRITVTRVCLSVAWWKNVIYQHCVVSACPQAASSLSSVAPSDSDQVFPEGFTSLLQQGTVCVLAE